ncbi:MAG: undecaprenyl/decaprenyl-phosphate alpha-N-acetylglucosaminyl 1-phosphate transferase [Pyrinomonadaceae bacterium]|nr:undecaprenyl/decaprenyl-phosphate alpha-N-acetylglucosaminyl 1-phosphate transferase [Pyrinomonadaceae bacterium]
MNTFLTLFVIATFTSLVLTPIIRRISERFDWLDQPLDQRRMHRQAVSRLGGVAVFASVSLTLATLPLVDNLVTDTLRKNGAQLLAIFIPAILIFLFGVYDDLREASARGKFIAQALAGVLFYVLGGRIEALSVPIVGSFELPTILGFAATICWVVGICNAFNLIDGMDGLGAGAGLFASLVMLVVSLMLNHPVVTVVTLALAGALIGFLRYNFNPASIFLGDSGSLFIGFLLAALSVQSTQKASTAVAVAIPLLAFGLPVIDTSVALARRFISGRPLFEGDREHIHHMLLAHGWSQRRVVFVLYGVCALFGIVSLLFVSETGRATGLILFVVAVAAVFAVGRLRYHEVDEFKASMRRNLAERRIRVANNIRVRRASRAMSKATALSELFTAVRQMLELSEFVYAVVQLGGGSDDAGTERALSREINASSLRGAQMRDGLIWWEWERGDIEASEINGSGLFWSLLLPLSTDSARWGHITLYRELGGDGLLLDVNYLCVIFQREMAQAAERILGAGEEEARASSKQLADRMTTRG